VEYLESLSIVLFQEPAILMDSLCCIMILLLTFGGALSQGDFRAFPEDKNIEIYMEAKKTVPNWIEAKKACEKVNSHLAVLKTPKLWNWVWEELNKIAGLSRRRYDFRFCLAFSQELE